MYSIEIFDDEHGEPRWRIRHQNGNIIATSGEAYSDRTQRNDTVKAFSEAFNSPAQTIDVVADWHNADKQ
jgi:uncharacterized protein YegP (UPF0339 family)